MMPKQNLESTLGSSTNWNQCFTTSLTFTRKVFGVQKPQKKAS